MARLNDTTAPSSALDAQALNGEDQPTAETFEAVKRSLMRQNRNLARSHSAQSLQLRTCVTQISNLLATNTALKEENIRLRRELFDAQDHVFKSGIDNLKNALNARLKDMAALVNTLDRHATPTLSPQASPETRKNVCLESMQFRDRPSLREIMSETQMPVIPESSAQVEEEVARAADGWLYRISEAQTPMITEMPALVEEEVARLSNGSVDSLELGPPPTSRLECEILCEPTPEIANDMGTATSSINVDARRKRKDSIGANHTRRRSTLVSPLLQLEKTPSSLKAGAKRKISDRNRDDVVLDRDDGFQYSRKSSSNRRETPIVTAQGESHTLTANRSAREVLGEKSTNFSPKKPKVLEEKQDSAKAGRVPDKATSRKSTRGSRGGSIPILRQIELEPANIAVPQTEPIPKTPAAFQILSPNSSEPASRGVGKADTPPPSDLSISSSTASMEGTRPSRRARAAVNYAEPSLVAKMRRPGKEMLDALSGLQDPRNVMSTSRRHSQDATGQPLFKSDAISTDSRAHNRRSPLTRKTEDEIAEELEQSPVEERSSSLSLATLMVGSKSTAENKRSVPEEELDIFDFKDTTPPDSPEQGEIITKTRRHSATPKTSEKVVASKEVALVSRPTKAAVRRKSMMV